MNSNAADMWLNHKCLGIPLLGAGRGPLPSIHTLLSSRLGLPCLVEITESICCPFCGQTFELAIDTSIATQRFTTDCEVCCRPFEVFVECEPGEILGLDTAAA